MLPASGRPQRLRQQRSDQHREKQEDEAVSPHWNSFRQNDAVFRIDLQRYLSRRVQNRRRTAYFQRMSVDRDDVFGCLAEKRVLENRRRQVICVRRSRRTGTQDADFFGPDADQDFARRDAGVTGRQQRANRRLDAPASR